MSLNPSPAIKGLITAGLMILVTVIIDMNRAQLDPRFQYIVFGLYAAGIAWTIFSSQGSFGDLFGQGFRCFIIVTLLMVIFTFIFIKMHPELAQQEAVNTRLYYQGKDKTPAEIESIVAKAKKQYPIAVISISIFRYLIIGALVSAIFSALQSRRQS